METDKNKRHRVAEWIKKARSIYMLQIQRHTSEGMKKILHANRNEKEAGVEK